MIDCYNFLRCLPSAEVGETIRRQIGFADRILINKIDLVSEDQIAYVDTQIDALNVLAERQRCMYSSTALDFVLDIQQYSDETCEDRPTVCMPCEEQDRKGIAQLKMLSLAAEKSKLGTQIHFIPADFRTHSLKIKGTFHLKKLELWLDKLLYTGLQNEKVHGTSLSTSSEIFRLKAIIHVEGRMQLHIVQAVHDVFEITESTHAIGSINDNTEGLNLFVFIGKNIMVCDIEDGINLCLSEI